METAGPAADTFLGSPTAIPSGCGRARVGAPLLAALRGDMAAGDVDNAKALLVEAFEISNDLDMLPLKEKVIPLQIQADN